MGYEALNFKVSFPPEMKYRERLRWNPIIRLIHTVSQQQKIHVSELQFHHHSPPRRTWKDHHDMGEADLDDKIIYLCSKDFDTALHELAHIWTDTYHTEKWAGAYVKLCLIYLLPSEAQKNIKSSSGQYDMVKKVAKKLNMGAWLSG